MYNNENLNDLARLKLEDYIWFFYGSIIIANIYGNYYEKEYLKTQNKALEDKADHIFETLLILNFFIYIYFLVRNYNALQKADPKEKFVFQVRVLGSCFLIAGVLCLTYFQFNHSSFAGSTSR